MTGNVRRRILGATGIVVGGFVAAKVVSLVKARLIAQAFGAGPQYDAFTAANRLPELLFTLIAGGALATVFIPVFTDYLAAADRDRAWRVASSVVNAAFLATAVGAAVLALFAPNLMAALAPGFPPEQQALAAGLMRVILLSTIIFSISGFVMGMLNAHQHFLLPAVAPIFLDVGVIFSVLILVPHWPGPERIYGLAWGIVLGAALHLLVQVPGLIYYRARWVPTLRVDDPGLRRVAQLMGPRMISLGIFQVNQIVAINLASGLIAGSVSAIGYGWQLQQVPETLIGTALATAVFPTLAEQASRRDQVGWQDTLTWSLAVILLLTVPATLMLILLAQPLTGLFLRGGAFGAADTSMVSWALQGYALGLVGQSLLEIVARSFYARQDTRTPMLTALLGLPLHLGLCLALVGPLNIGGLALANSVTYTTEAGILWWLMRQQPVTGEARRPARS